ncbi:hypothetical protein ACI78T_07430 [Blastococcus sp. SYSU D00922]
MTEVPGTDRDQARENVLEETPTAPESVKGAEGDQDGGEGDQAKPTPGSTDPVT